MSITNLCVLHGYSNGEGWYEERLRKALSWKGLPFEAKVKHGILWFATAVERGRKFKTRTLKSAGLRHPKPFHQPSCKPPAPNLFQTPSPTIRPAAKRVIGEALSTSHSRRCIHWHRRTQPLPLFAQSAFLLCSPSKPNEGKEIACGRVGCRPNPPRGPISFDPHYLHDT